MHVSSPTATRDRTDLFRREDFEILTGRAKYTGDQEPNGVLYAAIYRSPYPHAQIKSIDLKAACMLPGVVGGFTGATVPDFVLPMAQAQMQLHKTGGAKPNPLIRHANCYCLARGKVRWVGEPVAVIVAADRYIAQDALDLIEAEYEPLPPVVDAEEALREGSPLLYEEWGCNVKLESEIRNGSVEEAFAAADYVVEERIKSHRFSGTPMECRSVVAKYDPAHRYLEMWDTTQSPHNLAILVEGCLGIPSLRVRVHSEIVGGGFGQKVPFYPEEQLIPALAIHFGQPVKWTELRREHMVASHHAREQTHHIRAAVRKDGRVLAIDDTIYANLGAGHAVHAGYASHMTTSLFVPGVYDMQNYRCKLYSVTTNKTPFGAHRGLGKSEAAYVSERLTDILAHRIGMDPVDFRLKNFIQPEDFPYMSASGNRYDSGNYPAALLRAVELVDYHGWRARQAEMRQSGNGSRFLGIGVGVCVEPSSSSRRGSPTSGYYSIRLQINQSGLVTAFISGNDEGQGHEACVQQIMAQELGVSPDDVFVVEGDSLACPVGPGSHAGRFSVVGTAACYEAARLMAAHLKKLVAHERRVPIEDLYLAGGEVRSRSSDLAVSLRAVSLMAHTRPFDLPPGIQPGLELIHHYQDPNAPGVVDDQGRVGMFGSYPYTADIAVVEIDADTGLFILHKYVSVHDCGTILNHKIVEGQHMGALAHGFGGALYEHFAYDANGQPLNQTFMDYLVPSAMEIPEVVMDHIETPNPFTPGGHKGGSETGTVSVPPVMANAMEDALRPLGIKVRETPLTPEYIWRQIQVARAIK